MPRVGAAAAARSRTADAETSGCWEELLVCPRVAGALRAAGYAAPGPAQRAAVPLALAGNDVVVRAKAGTGKTLCFGVAVASRVDPATPRPQAVCVAPTREVALQTAAVLGEVAPGLRVAALVGGVPHAQDAAALRAAPCHVACGTPGRLAALLRAGTLPSGDVALLVLDEADALLSNEGMRDDVRFVCAALPAGKQTLACSATLGKAKRAAVEALMRRPHVVDICAEEGSSALRGVRQLYAAVPAGLAPLADLAERERALLRVVSAAAFTQAVVFTNRRGWGESLARKLTAAGLLAAFTCGSHEQARRAACLEAVRSMRLRVLVTTDLTARGVDLQHVNLVVNMDVPPGRATYLHRVGRTGRFGTAGVAVSIVAEDEVGRLKVRAAGADPTPALTTGCRGRQNLSVPSETTSMRTFLI